MRATRGTTRALIGAAYLAISGTAIAGETINYSYDGRGVLVKVQRTGTVNNGVTADYTHDKAGNRTNVTVTGSGGGATGPNFSLQGPTSATEGNLLTFVLNKTGTTTGACYIYYSTANGTATSPADFGGALPSPQYFGPGGNETQFLTFSTVADGVAEGSETMTLQISSPTCTGSTIGTASVTGTINDP